MTTERTPPQPRPRRRRRLLWTSLGLLAAGLAAAVAAAPRWLSRGTGRAWLVAQADAALAPGRLELATLRLTWFGPTRLTGVVLRDREGDPVVTAPSATWDRGLWQALFDRPRLGTIRLDGAAVDAERRDDGAIDVIKTLAPLFANDQPVELKVVVEDGRFRLRGKGLAKPVVAERFGLVLEIPRRPQPLTWSARLADGPKGAETATLAIVGRFDVRQARSGGPADFQVDVEGRDWPWAVAVPDLGVASGRFAGKAGAGREQGTFRTTGDARLDGLDVPGPTRLGRLDGAWDVARDPAGAWSAPKLALATGDPQGAWSAKATARPLGDGFEVDAAVVAKLPGLDGPDSVEPLTLAVRAAIPREGRRVALSRVVATTRYGRLDASGEVADLNGRRDASFTGAITPDWDALNARLAAEVDPRGSVRGRPRPFTLKARLGDDWRESLDGEFGLRIDGADLFGLKLGATEVTARVRKGAVVIDPIGATLNGGSVHVAPEVVLNDGPRDDAGLGPQLRLGPGTTFKDVEVNDEVSRRVLSFVAPVLDKATRVHGRVSAEFSRVVIPLRGGRTADAVVDGTVVFQDVVFGPGPLAEGVLNLLDAPKRGPLRLNDPVSLRIADRKVTQRGLAIPIGDLTRVELEGSVDFDRNLDLTAKLPVTAAMVANRPVLSAIVEGTSIQVPIGGTLDRPKVDKEAFNLALKDLGRSLLNRAVSQGIPSLLMKLAQPRDPNAPEAAARPAKPRLTPEERKALRDERKAERRERRGLER